MRFVALKGDSGEVHLINPERVCALMARGGGEPGTEVYFGGTTMIVHVAGKPDEVAAALLLDEGQVHVCTHGFKAVTCGICMSEWSARASR